MSFAKGAFSRHMMNRTKRSARVKQYGSRHAYRAAKRGLGGRGASF